MQELRPGRLGEVGVPPDCHARQGSGWESWVGAAVQQVRRNRCRSGTCSAVAPGVKVNLKPSPSRLSKQKQRPAQLMNIHYPRNPIPAPLHPPRSQGPPGTAWPGGGNPKGNRGGENRGASRLILPLSGACLHPQP